MGLLSAIFGVKQIDVNDCESNIARIKAMIAQTSDPAIKRGYKAMLVKEQERLKMLKQQLKKK